VLAVIPARGGSKGIPRKNLAPLAGRPLISHTLAAARAAKTVTDIMVTTDDEEIAAICEAEGVPVPYRRPRALAGDAAGMVDTVLDALDWWVARRSEEPELIVLLQPTSPLRRPEDVDGTVGALRRSGRQSAVSVHQMTEHPMECISLVGRGWTMLVHPSAGAVSRQDYEGQFYFINGAVYVTTPTFLRTRRALVAEGDETALYVMDAVRGIDVDDEDDLDMAEAILGHVRLRRRVQG
jgi:N-acylneuraminate cytidylyltransferase/CMP-N,N'-diacetyllegionaminic acid synthase